MHLWAINVNIELQLLADRLDVLETLLIVGTRTTDPDLDLVFDQLAADLSESSDDTLKCGRHVGEVGNTATDEENLALWGERSAEHEVKNSAGVVEGLGLSWGTGVFTVVGELVSETSGGNGVSVDH